MGIFELAGNLAAGIQGARLGKKQMVLGQEMMEEARSLSDAFARPEMTTPAAYNLLLNMSKGRMFQNMPGYNLMQNQINQATASGLEAMKEMGTGAEAFGGVADLYKNQLLGQSDLAVQNAQYRSMAEQDYMGALAGLSDLQQQQWQWNLADPYLQAQYKAAALETAGRQGEWEGLKTKMGSWAESFQGMGSELDASLNEAGAAIINAVAPGAGTVLSAMTG